MAGQSKKRVTPHSAMPGSPPPPTAADNTTRATSVTGQWAIDKFLEGHPVLKNWLVHFICFGFGAAAIYSLFAIFIIPGKQEQIDFFNRKLDDVKNYPEVVAERDKLKGETNVLASEKDQLFDQYQKSTNYNLLQQIRLQDAESNIARLSLFKEEVR